MGVLFLLLSSVCFAFTSEDISFNAELAHRQLDQINIELAQANADLVLLEQLDDQLQVIQKQAQACIDVAVDEQTWIQKELDSIVDTEEIDPIERDYLNGKLAQTTQVLSRCRIAKLRTMELRATVSEQIEQAFISRLFTFRQPIWDMLPAAALALNH